MGSSGMPLVNRNVIPVRNLDDGHPADRRVDTSGANVAARSFILWINASRFDISNATTAPFAPGLCPISVVVIAKVDSPRSYSTQMSR